MKFRRKPVVVEAMQYKDTKPGHKEILKFCPTGRFFHGVGRDFFEFYKFSASASPNDWIIKGVHGELYRMSNKDFMEDYEPADMSLKE